LENNLIDKAIVKVKSLKVDLPNIAIILGSGLGNFIHWVDNPTFVNFEEIPGFKTSTAPSHGGKLIFGTFKGVNLCLMQGRLHLYEGYNANQVTFPIRVMRKLGAKNLIITNAAGSLNKDYKPGDIMLIKDHINFTGENPLVGMNDDTIGQRFPDMSNAYCKILRELSIKILTNNKIHFNQGIYSGIKGPSLETSAERRFLKMSGADAVGMSTVLENIAAIHCGFSVLGISAITNSATGGPDQKPDNIDDIFYFAEIAGKKIIQLFKGLIPELGEENVSI
tara:strand:+ start:3660 stop:4499 length:840 start_codon:yes stop_codon:yes gene_type:complete